MIAGLWSQTVTQLLLAKIKNTLMDFWMDYENNDVRDHLEAP